MIHADTLPAMRIRSCQPRQAGLLTRLHASLFEAAWDAESFQGLLADPATLAFTAGPGEVSAEGQTLPWGLIVGRVAADEGELLTLAVARERQRRGIGARLVERLCRAVGERGARRLYLEVAEGNAPARALYARLGFLESGRRRAYYEQGGGAPEDAINMYLALQPTPARPRGGRHPGPRL
jgi:ribosomal-protein-alanine N-acetyltransferase